MIWIVTDNLRTYVFKDLSEAIGFKRYWRVEEDIKEEII